VIKNLAKEFLGFSKNLVSAVPAASKKGGSNLSRRVPEIIGSLEKVPVHVADGVQSVITEITDYLKISEIESTKRTDIIARRDIAMQTLQNQRAVFEQLMQHTFQERAAVLQKQFDALDHAMSNGDLATIDKALSGMVSVIQTSPFKSIQEMQTALGSKDFVVRLE
jgi:hypothetical protein